MSVLFISHKYPPATGGMEKQSFELIQGYAKRATSYSLVFDQQTNKFLFFLHLRRKVHALISNHPDISIIHLNDGLMATFFYILGIKTFGRKVAVTLHGLDVVFPFKIYQQYILQRIKNYDVFICVSEATKLECLKRNFNEEKLKVVANGVDTNHHTNMKNNQQASNLLLEKYNINTEKDKIILAIGRPVRRKGFSWFASQVLPQLGPDFKFLHIGDVKSGNTFIRKILPKGWTNLIHLFLGYPDDGVTLSDLAKSNTNIVLAGKISDEERNLLLHNALFVILPNIKVEGDMEGFGLVALEASIYGKTVLAADIEGITDAIHHQKNGYLLHSGKAMEWIENIRKYTPITPQYDEKIVQYTAANFSWSKMIDGYQKVFQNLISIKNVGSDTIN